MHEVWENAEEYVLDDGGRNGSDGWRTCCRRKQRGLNVRMLSSFPEDVEPPPPSVADIERFQYKAAWRRTDLVHRLLFQAQLENRHVRDNSEGFR